MPSAAVLESKKQVVVELADNLKGSAAGVLVDYRGLTVEQDTKLRNELRAAGVTYVVVKNTLLRLASREVGLEEFDPILHGPTALAYHETDMIAPAKILCEFAKKNPKLEVKAGFVEGKVISADDVKALAEVPPKEVLIAMVLRGFNAPISGFANVLNANIRGLAIALKAIVDKKSA